MIKAFQGEYRFLSNFYPAPLVFNGVAYPSSEHAYMAQKTLDEGLRMAISEAATPGEAKRLGRSIPLRPDWEAIKKQVMLDVVTAKFTQNQDLLVKLLQTGDQELVEGNNWGDRFWGVCPVGSDNGENWLGKTLMQVRASYRVNVPKPNKLIIAGGRDFNDRELMLDRVKELERLGVITEHTTLICGMARGADLMGHSIFKQAGLVIEEMPADWDRLGKRAGFIRNQDMGRLADVALIFWDGQSRGTKHMIEVMESLGKTVYLVRY